MYLPLLGTVARQQGLVQEAFQQVAGELDLLQLDEGSDSLVLLTGLEQRGDVLVEHYREHRLLGFIVACCVYP